MVNSFQKVILEAVDVRGACVREMLGKMKAIDSESIRRMAEYDSTYMDMICSKNSRYYDRLSAELQDAVKQQLWGYLHQDKKNKSADEPDEEKMVDSVTERDTTALSEADFLAKLKEYIADNGKLMTGYQVDDFAKSLHAKPED